MSRDLVGRTALVTGAGRGQGRAHALALARAGADVVVFDVVDQLAGVEYDMARPDDLAATVEQVEALDRRCVPVVGDVRSSADLERAVAEAVALSGRIDIAVANAGVCVMARPWETTDEQWDTVVGVNLGGVFRTLRAVASTMVDQGGGGSIVVTSSVCGERPQEGLAAYTATKHGVVGLMRSFALELAPLRIRVNAVAPGNVDTGMIDNPPMHRRLRPDLDAPTKADAAEAFQAMNPIPEPWAQPEDISAAVVWLASDDARLVTGQNLAVDAGLLLR